MHNHSTWRLFTELEKCLHRVLEHISSSSAANGLMEPTSDVCIPKCVDVYICTSSGQLRVCVCVCVVLCARTQGRGAPREGHREPGASFAETPSRGGRRDKSMLVQHAVAQDTRIAILGVGSSAARATLCVHTHTHECARARAYVHSRPFVCMCVFVSSRCFRCLWCACVMCVLGVVCVCLVRVMQATYVCLSFACLCVCLSMGTVYLRTNVCSIDVRVCVCLCVSGYARTYVLLEVMLVRLAGLQCPGRLGGMYRGCLAPSKWPKAYVEQKWDQVMKFVPRTASQPIVRGHRWARAPRGF